jgi:hypothetical protein
MRNAALEISAFSGQANPFDRSHFGREGQASKGSFFLAMASSDEFAGQVTSVLTAIKDNPALDDRGQEA